MQTSQHSIDNQIFSFKAYQRLRDSLMRQEHFFEVVVTKADLADANITATDSHINLDRLDEDASEAGSPKADRFEAEKALGEIDFVLMRSPTLSVLLTAAPLSSFSAAPSTKTTHRRTLPHSSHRQSILHNAPYTAAHDVDHSDYLNGGSPVLPQTSFNQAPFIDPTHRPHRTTQSHQQGAHQQGSRPQSGNKYQVNLTFNNTKVERFMAQLPLNPNGLQSKRIGNYRLEGHSSDGTQSTYHAQPKPKESDSAHPDTFFLSWARGLATAPDGDSQPVQSNTLKNEIEQSLLLNQVITRIRHSLDLPSILETTVAQVREFLSADRLVLYQFDSVEDSTDADEHSMPQPARASSTASRQIGNVDSGTASGTASDKGFTTGKQVHVAHVSYEARLSEEILSVLDFAEESCFGPALPNYSRYLLGQPVAVDNIDEQYAHAGCLVDFLHRAQVKSQIIAPIIIKGRLWGLLIAHQCAAYRHWQKTETIFLQHIAEHLAVAIEQASLYHQLQQQKVSLESCVVERTQNLQDALKAAASADRTKGEFLSTMSHELRTPLTYIIGMSATLLRWSFGELSERQRSYLTTINHSGEQLLGVINDILEFAKVEAGRSQLQVSGFALPKLVSSVVAHHQAMATNHDVRLNLECALDPDYTNFQADSKRIEQILSNLINNAIKFTPAGGQVTISVYKEHSAILLQVADTGIGIPKSQKQFLFEKFKQLESPFRRQYSGTGLGLAMTKHLVELHGGTIQVNSAVGKGSTFIVSLPVRSKQSPEGRYHVPPALEQSTKPVVLLLEAEENSAAVICELLTADGYEVIWLTPAEDIAIQLSLLKPAMLIADLSLLSHRQDKIKAIEQSITTVGTRVLALLDRSTSQSSHIAHHDTLDKPIEPKKLIEKARQLILEKTQTDRT